VPLPDCIGAFGANRRGSAAGEYGLIAAALAIAMLGFIVALGGGAPDGDGTASLETGTPTVRGTTGDGAAD